MGSKFLTDLSDGRYVVRLPRSWGGYFRNEADHRDFVAIGMAAGEPLRSVEQFVNTEISHHYRLQKYDHAA